MRVLKTSPILAGYQRTTVLRFIALLGLVWGILAFSGPSTEGSEKGAQERITSASPVVPAATTVSLSLVRPVDGTPAPATGSLRVAHVLAPGLPPHNAAPGRATFPTFFERVSYRTTGPPPTHG